MWLRRACGRRYWSKLRFAGTRANCLYLLGLKAIHCLPQNPNLGYAQIQHGALRFLCAQHSPRRLVPRSHVLGEGLSHPNNEETRSLEPRSGYYMSVPHFQLCNASRTKTLFVTAKPLFGTSLAGQWPPDVAPLWRMFMRTLSSYGTAVKDSSWGGWI